MHREEEGERYTHWLDTKMIDGKDEFVCKKQKTNLDVLNICYIVGMNSKNKVYESMASSAWQMKRTNHVE